MRAGLRPGRPGRGRPKGALNKSTVEIRAVTKRLFDRAYWHTLKHRLDRGQLAPMLEARLLAYQYGEPKQTVEIPGLSDVATLLARKVVHRLEPGPSQRA